MRQISPRNVFLVCMHVLNPRPVRGGVDATPPMSFSELDATPFGESC